MSGFIKDPRSIHFISPLPIEECVSRLKRIAYSGKHKDYLHIDSITQKEYVIKSWVSYTRAPSAEVVDGRLHVHRSGGTEVYARMIPRTGLVLGGILVLALGILLSQAPAVRGFELWFLLAAMGVMVTVQGLSNTQANEVLDQIQLLLNANSVQPSNSPQSPNPPVEIPRKRDYHS